ncbi:MAG TPA: glucokinase [Rudaea sp.]|nr:glucokinase [Rudaea sp.]
MDDPDLRANFATQPFLAADVGGTHARVALVRVSQVGSRELDVLAYRKFACKEFPSLSELLEAFLARDARFPVQRCVLACAGQVMGDEILHDNLAWPIRLSELRDALAFDDVAALNDFEALAYALDDPLARLGRLLCGPDVHEPGPILVIGPGTGLGAAARLPRPAGGSVLTTEAGQMDFAPHTIREREILARLAPQGGYVAYERITSGPGLLTLYTTLCGLHGVVPRLATPEAVTAAALADDDARAVEAAEIFCATLGSFTGSLAMAFMPTGGIYLGGGFLYAMFSLLERSAFVERFLHARSVRSFLSHVPVRVMEHGRHGVLGAANWYLRHAGVAGASERSPVPMCDVPE